MKKSILFLGGFITCSITSFAQQTPVSQTPQNKNAILEELTGINCQYCPDGHRIANNLANANPGRVVLVNVHAGGYAAPGTGQPNLRTTDGTALDGFFDPDGYPAGTVQRTRFGSESVLATGRGNWGSQINSTLSQASPVNIAMNASINAATRELTLNVEIYYTTPQTAGTNHYLNIGILQNNYEGPQVGSGYNTAAVLPNGKYLHQHMFRGYINTGGTWGEQIDASQTGVITKTVTYTLPANINNVPLSIGDLEFFAFLHEGHNTATNSKVVTAAKVDPEYTNVPAATGNANSIINNLLACNGGTVAPVVKVTNSGAAITAIEFSSSVAGGTAVPYSWTGSIPQFGSAEITIPALTVNSTSNTNVVVNITSVNGGTGTIGTASTTKAVTVAQNTANDATGVVKVSTDRYGSETTWKLYNSANAVVAQGGPYSNAGSNGTYPQNDVNFTIAPNECYKLVVSDEYGDGFTGSYGNGKIEVLSNGTTVSSITSFTSSEKMDGFQSATNLSVVDASDVESMNIYPNPASDKVNVSFEAIGGDYSIEITDLQGRIVTSETHSNLTGNQVIEVNTSSLKTGNYLISIAKDGASFTKLISIK
jgi:hypothetical protein